MPIHDYNIANQTFPATRSDINNALEAIVTKNSSGTAPPDTYAYMWWYDTATTTLKIRNRDDDAWISFASFDQDNDTVNFLDSEVSIAGVTTSATGTVLTLTDSTITSSVDFIIDNQKEIRFRETTANGTNYVALKAPASLTTDTTFILPSADGTANQILKTDGSANLSFVDAFTGIAWQSVKTADFTAVKGEAYPVDTTSVAITVTLPATPSAGDQVQLVDYAGTFDTNALTIDGNGEDIIGQASNVLVVKDREAITLTYIDSTQGWLPTSGYQEGTQGLSVPYSVDFLVIAGGGSGGKIPLSGAGGGGAGGYRNSYSTETSGGGGTSEASLTFISGTVYTITVGAGGAAVAVQSNGNSGVNSSISGTGISTITSTGGGAGVQQTATGVSGGSGGGAGNSANATGGAGTANQGFAGGDVTNSSAFPVGGGGGGAGAIGITGTSSGSTGVGGNGGAGLASSITGSSITRAGGGGGGADTRLGNTQGTGGSGGGGNATTTTGGSGTINTGSGGGAGGSGNSGAGGKGVVILRMPTVSYSGTTTGSPTVTTDGTDTVIVFNDSGSITG